MRTLRWSASGLPTRRVIKAERGEFTCTPVLQRKFLILLPHAAECGDVPRKQVAFLTDRLRFNENRPQLYGTVLDWNERGELSCEVDDPANLDARRNEVGLVPFHEDLEKHREEVKSEGGMPPKDFAEYKQKGGSGRQVLVGDTSTGLLAQSFLDSVVFNQMSTTVAYGVLNRLC